MQVEDAKRQADGTGSHQRIEELEGQVEELQRQLARQAAQTNRAIAALQERTYWLDRWHVDLNALMKRRGAAELRAALRAGRAVVRRAKMVRDVLRAR